MAGASSNLIQLFLLLTMALRLLKHRVWNIVETKWIVCWLQSVRFRLEVLFPDGFGFKYMCTEPAVDEGLYGSAILAPKFRMRKMSKHLPS